MNDTKILQNYYETHPEDMRLTTRPGQVEYLTTMRYIERYLSPGCRILDIGAGTGRYSLALAQKGYTVEAVELCEHNIHIFRNKVNSPLPLRIHQGNALDLHQFSDQSFDITMILGPMYHLYTFKEQEQALKEAVRVTKKGGVLLVAYCMSDAAILQHGFVRGNVRTLIENGLLDPHSFCTHSRPEDIIALHRTDDIKALRKNLPVRPIVTIASDGFAHHIRETLENMDEETFGLYLKYHFAVCERSDLVGSSNHTLDILQRI